MSQMLEKKVMNLNISKASLNSDIPAKLIKENLKAFKDGILGLILVAESYLKMMKHHLISPQKLFLFLRHLNYWPCRETT